MSNEELKKLDFERYQTVYAREEGSVAAPTAGLHFTQEILKKLEDKGVQVGYVTLNVGIGTFRPVKCDNILEHHMDSETFEIKQETADLINQAKAEGKKLVAVGTTTVRTLAGKDFVFEAYKKAIEEKYRFYSYGDCMFIN